MLRGAIFFLIILGLAAPLAPPAHAANEPPYEGRLLRLAEILGSLHYLRNLCGETGSQWRDEMEELLRSENPEPRLRARFVSSFNSGYRSFSGVYSGCTESAYAAINRYMKEGEELSREIAVRFGN